MLNLFWRGVAAIVSKPKVADLLIRRAMKTPFSHLPNDDDPSYMERYWLFNAYPVSSKDRTRWQFPWSIRLHLIKRPDAERDMHDHPWNARTIILKGGYTEKRLLVGSDREDIIDHFMEGYIASHGDSSLANLYWEDSQIVEYFQRNVGDTATIKHNEYHTITDITDGHAWTMFISGPWLGDWGFLRNGVKVWWRTYLAEKEAADLQRQQNINERFGKFGSKDNLLFWYGREEDLIAKPFKPNVLLRDLDEVGGEKFADLSDPRKNVFDIKRIDQ